MDVVKLHEAGYKIFCYKYFKEVMGSLLINALRGGYPIFYSSRHAATYKVSHPSAGELFIKFFKPEGLLPNIKDIFRGSRAYRAWKAGEMLKKTGFRVPEVVAFGEKRRFGLLKEAFMATVPIKGYPLQDGFLSMPFRVKRNILCQLGREVGRLHKHGIIHGDLLPGNIFVVEEEGRYFISLLDNEATRKYRTITVSQRVKNLVQINRMAIPGVTATDRIRFFDAYLEENPSLKPEGNNILKNIVKITAERVMRHRGIPIDERKEMTFRKLMQWKGERIYG